MHSNAAVHGTCQGTECIFKSIGEQNIVLHSKKKLSIHPELRQY